MKQTVILLLLCSVFTGAKSQPDTLPKPTGKYLVGVTYRNFIDYNRREVFDSTQSSFRELTVKVWYPSDQKSVPEPYFLKAEADIATKYIQYPALYKDLKTNSSRDVPVSSKANNYPVLIFSHGLGEHYSQNTILMEELASHGYIIFSIAHHYECKFSSYPDGRFIYLDVSNPRLQKIMYENMMVSSKGYFDKLGNATTDDEREHIFRDILTATPIITTESSTYWAADISFLIDELDRINDDDYIFCDKLDLGKIGVLGMSLGGLATSVTCSRDERVKAGVNMDGAFPFASIYGNHQAPFLYLNSPRYLGCGPLFVSHSKKDCYSLTVRGAGHFNFTDHTLYSLPMVDMLLGPIDGERALKITNTVVLAFFDKYLNKNESQDIISLADGYPEIEVSSNLRIY
jgi:predicted dienelactone hydrolase